MKDKTLEEIGIFECKQCEGICLFDKYRRYFVCQHCGTKYVFKEEV